MHAGHWFTLAALTLFAAEGFVLSVFPLQFQHYLANLNPRALQAIGLAETILALSLAAGIVWG